MAKRFRLKIARVIPSFQSCRSKDPSDLPENPVPSFFRLSPTTTKVIDHVDVHPSTERNSSLKRVSAAIVSVGCGFRSRSARRYLSDDDGCIESQDYSWQKEEKWHVVAKIYDETPRRKIYNSSASGGSDGEELPPTPPPPPPPTAEKKKRRSKKKKATSTSRVRASTSSAYSGLFSSDQGCDDDEGEDEETETLVSSSRSFSNDDTSSEFNPHLQTIREGSTKAGTRRRLKKKKINGVQKVKRSAKRCISQDKANKKHGVGLSSSPDIGASPARLSMFQRLIPCTVDGKVRESFAVVKKSEDPYEDFKRSMMEMILEKQMFEEKDLEQLLHCFLSLNSRHHHGVIIEVFSEIWEALFCKNPSSNRTVVLRKQSR